jgi:hypothetical protein
MSVQQEMQVVPGLVWNQDKYNKALKDNTYVYVRSQTEIAEGEANAASNDGKGIKKTGQRKLSNAPKVWKVNANYVVDTQYRICGDFEQVAKALFFAGQFASYDLAEQYIQSNPNGTVLHSGNYLNNPLFDQEEKKTATDNLEKKTSRYRLEDIILFSKHIKSVQIPREVVNAQGNVSTSPRTKRNKPVSLADKINKAVAEGKILDISKMKENGSESRSKPQLKEGSKSLLRNTTNFPFLYSNKVEPLQYAIKLLYGDAGLVTYAADLEELRQKLSSGKPSVSAPVVSNPSMPLPMAKTPVFSAR